MEFSLWLFVVAGGPIIIGAAIAYALLRRRRMSVAEHVAHERGTERLYDDNSDEDISRPARPTQSAAVASLEKERRLRAEGELEEGLEDTFPASDPVSINLDITEELRARGSVGTDGDTSIGVFFERDY
jgi:hypothetical protein